jgi:hypothetical protein
MAHWQQALEGGRELSGPMGINKCSGHKLCQLGGMCAQLTHSQGSAFTSLYALEAAHSRTQLVS